MPASSPWSSYDQVVFDRMSQVLVNVDQAVVQEVPIGKQRGEMLGMRMKLLIYGTGMCLVFPDAQQLALQIRMYVVRSGWEQFVHQVRSTLIQILQPDCWMVCEGIAMEKSLIGVIECEDHDESTVQRFSFYSPPECDLLPVLVSFL